MESQIESVKALDAYRLRQVKHIPELNSDGMILEHKKTGANIFLMSNEDNNKVFCIGFRTPPSDSTGVPHIIEHTVLCGSDKFPVKDPFVELVKGSLNTFLNAMTYPDKTVYPIASCNDTDFQNLMDVYMDAVFHPNIGKEKKIFMQEGWHYELEEPEGEITYNGVVYNEMKGVFSAPESVLDSYIHTAMFPDTCYGVESGGDIKTLQVGVEQDADGNRMIGVVFDVNHNIIAGMADGLKSAVAAEKLMFEALGDIITGQGAAGDVVGPIGIVNIVDQSVQVGLMNVIYLLPLLSLNLALVNILPFPALDGGRLLFILIRKITGKAVSDELEGKIHLIGMAILFSLMIFITLKDFNMFILKN